MSESTETPTAPKRRVSPWVWVWVGLGVLVVGALVALVVWSLGRDSGTAEDPTARRNAWTSAMRKAGVEATYPAAPVDLDSLDAEGSHPFEATFTSEELDALVMTYPFTGDLAGAQLVSTEFEFPSAGNAIMRAMVEVEGNTYQGSASGPVVYKDDRVMVDAAQTTLRAEGFKVSGERKEQALTALTDYVNDLIDAAPGLEVKMASVVAGGVRVSGTAPDRLTNPGD